eukprot:CAMPEP_0170190842 /NCGR_PEP_ID=MMETSP0040_2-20121228/50267_1 /TAXON_ID=641309 /ORGANISM="Lotharella oceanica, Strain CCMP622" /LENGTH=295 /DNA_ID=CAMNT_0010438791 /DNA_START=49 /DNA_END=936 /DNA_ORIENTATION=+
MGEVVRRSQAQQQQQEEEEPGQQQPPPPKQQQQQPPQQHMLYLTEGRVEASSSSSSSPLRDRVFTVNTGALIVAQVTLLLLGRFKFSFTPSSATAVSSSPRRYILDDSDVMVFLLVQYAAVPLLASCRPCPQTYWLGVGPADSHLGLEFRLYMFLFVATGLLWPVARIFILVASTSSSFSNSSEGVNSGEEVRQMSRHVAMLVVQILGEKLSTHLRLNMAAALALPVLMTSRRVWTCLEWFGASDIGAGGSVSVVAAVNLCLWAFNLVYTLLYVNVLPRVRGMMMHLPTTVKKTT